MAIPFRTGLGYDIHRTIPGRDLGIGGVQVPCAFGLDGHSDADVLTHAVCDALLGAAGLSDIGHFFPNTEENWKGASGEKLLTEVVSLIGKEGWSIGNVDAVLIAEKPKIAPYIQEMKAFYAKILDLPLTAVGVKATTQEKIGSLGEGKGMAAMATCLIYQQDVLDKASNPLDQ